MTRKINVTMRVKEDSCRLMHEKVGLLEVFGFKRLSHPFCNCGEFVRLKNASVSIKMDSPVFSRNLVCRIRLIADSCEPGVRIWRMVDLNSRQLHPAGKSRCFHEFRF